MVKSQDDRRMTELAIFVHGTLAGLHLLGVVYNLKKRNYWDAIAHAAAMGYDTWSVSRHVHDIERLYEETVRRVPQKG